MLEKTRSISECNMNSDEYGEDRKAKQRESSLTRNQINAGSVDAKLFKDNFYDVTNLSSISSKILSEKMMSIKATLSLSEEMWMRQQISLKDLRALIIAGAADFPEFEQLLRGIHPQLVQCVQNLRSVILREASITLSFLAQELGKKFENTAKILIPYFIQLIPNSAKVMSTSSITTLHFFFKNIHSQSLLKILVGYITHKSNLVRRHCCELIFTVMETWSSAMLERCLDMLVDFIAKGVIDADLEAREYSRKAFWILDEKFKSKADKLYLDFDAKTKKNLQITKNYSSCDVSKPIKLHKNSNKLSISSNRPTSTIPRRIPLVSKFPSKLHKAGETDDESSAVKSRSTRKDTTIWKGRSESTLDLATSHSRRSSSDRSLIPQYFSPHMDFSSRSTSPSSTGSLETKLRPLPLKVPIKISKSFINDKGSSQILNYNNPIELNTNSPFKSGGPVRRSILSNNNNTNFINIENFKPAYPRLSTVGVPAPDSDLNCDVFENIDELQQFVCRTSSENLGDESCSVVDMKEYCDYELDEGLNDEQELDTILIKLSSCDANERLFALERLTAFLRTDDSFLWMKHTSLLLDNLLLTLNPPAEPDWVALQLAFNILKIMLQRQPDCFANHSELLASSMLKSFKNEHKSFREFAVDVFALITSIMPLEKWLNLLLPHLELDNDKLLRWGALKMLGQVIESQSTNVRLREYVPIFGPPIVLCFQDPQSVIRKECCSTLVSLYLKIGDYLNLYTNQLSSTQKKILALYIKKEKSTDCDSAWIPLLCVHG